MNDETNIEKKNTKVCIDSRQKTKLSFTYAFRCLCSPPTQYSGMIRMEGSLLMQIFFSSSLCYFLLF